MEDLMYDEQADSIKIEDITNDDQNRAVLKRIKRNEKGDHFTLEIHENQHDDDEDIITYVPEGAKDMGWLGYFVGKSDCVEGLCINGFNGLSIDIFKPFIMGVSRNKSIYTLEYNRMHLSSGMFTLMGPLFKNNKNISNLHVNDCIVGVEGSRALSLALGSSKNNSLNNVALMNNNIADEGMVDIITSLSMHPQLQEIDFEGNCLRKNGCIAMATLLQNSVTKLETLDLGSNELDDESIDILVPALKNCNSLNILRLFTNHLITKRGWKQLSSVLESPNSTNIRELNIEDNNIDDEALTSFADVLKNNRTLTKLYVSISSTEGETGRAFSNLLCDTSTVNSTFLSNHTLVSMFGGHLSYDREHPLRPLLRPLLIRNEIGDKKEIAMSKILRYHNDFDMTSFFEWEFKVLPLMIDWFERASCFESMRDGIDMPGNFEPNIGPRRLSCIYQFVRGMPVEYVETCLMKELEDIKAQAHMEERKRGILERLGRNA